MDHLQNGRVDCDALDALRPLHPVHLPSRRRSQRGAFFFFFTLVTGPRRSLSLKLSDTRVYEPHIRARLGTTTHFCEVNEEHSVRVWVQGAETRGQAQWAESITEGVPRTPEFASQPGSTRGRSPGRAQAARAGEASEALPRAPGS